jgi:hypothetical protein
MMLRALTLAVAAMVLGTAAPAIGTATAATPTSTPTPSSCVVKIKRLQFRPAEVSSGESSTVHLRVRNCTNTTRTVTVTWLGSWVGSSPGFPPGCPAIDPLAEPLTVPAAGTARAHLQMLAIPGCTATGLVETARITGPNGAVLAQRSATLEIV